MQNHSELIHSGQAQEPQERVLTSNTKALELQSVGQRVSNPLETNTEKKSEESQKFSKLSIQQIGLNDFINATRRRLMLLYPHFLQSEINSISLSIWNRLDEDEKRVYCMDSENKLVSNDDEIDLLPKIKEKFSKLRGVQNQKQQQSKQQKGLQITEQATEVNKPPLVEEHQVLATELHQSVSSNSVQEAVSNTLSTCIANAELNCPQSADPQQKFILVECNNIELNDQEIEKLTNDLINAKKQNPTHDCKDECETITLVEQDEVKGIAEEQKEKAPQTETQIDNKPKEEEKETICVSSNPVNQC